MRRFAVSGALLAWLSVLAMGCGGPGAWKSPFRTGDSSIYSGRNAAGNDDLSNPLKRRWNAARNPAEDIAASDGNSSSVVRYRKPAHFDAEAQSMLDEILTYETPEGQQEILETVQDLPLATVKYVLKTRLALVDLNTSPNITPPLATRISAGHSQAGPSPHNAGQPVQQVGGTTDPYAHVPGRTPRTDPGVGGATPWGKPAPRAIYRQDRHVTDLPPAPTPSGNPVELAPAGIEGGLPFSPQRPLTGAATTAGPRQAPTQYLNRQDGRTAGAPRVRNAQVPPYSLQKNPFEDVPANRIASGDPNQRIPGAVVNDVTTARLENLASGKDWSGDLLGVISRVETQLDSQHYADMKTPAEKLKYVREHVFLRMLYLMVGRQERSLAAIPDIPANEREYWQQVFWAMGNYFDDEAMPDPDYRATQVVTQLRAAIHELQESARLELKNVSFCRKITSFGNYERFETDSFRPGEPVLLYAEVANFKSVPSADVSGYFQTKLTSRIEIRKLGNVGEPDEDMSFQETTDLCRNHRRDYFHSYEFTVPHRLPRGPHVLTLIVEDTLGKKIATYRLNFTVK